ncbi:hypothetical protein ASZ90_010162 [hydrocarbon metagenome]|uniref:Uncharacterized protein n=1 Tax=hydrocarbon metagenome TaxID=938273 RepID=A0A0W8FHH8_9ZZZZ
MKMLPAAHCPGTAKKTEFPGGCTECIDPDRARSLQGSRCVEDRDAPGRGTPDIRYGGLQQVPSWVA